MNAYALIVGNANYRLAQHRLVNAVNDAKDVSAKLLRLGFVVKTLTDCTVEEFDKEIHAFGNRLKNFDVGLFYFSGHGIQIEGKNYLTSIDTNFTDEYSVKHRTIPLDEIITRMEKAGPKIKILILDACRDNPLPSMRTIANPGLAPVYAPKGTMIAYSTSPGEKAMDYGSGRNSIYTGSFLRHIEDEGVAIEDFFKRVRTSVFDLSKEKQTSWEHTSLIGDFYFNNGQLVHSLKLPYKEDCVADSKFKTSGSKFDDIIMDLKSYNYTTQNNAISRLDRFEIEGLNKNQLFLLGRNILQVACDNASSTQRIMKHLDTWLLKFSIGKENHVLNGMLFEMYFNSKGKFRQGKFKTKRMEELFALRINLNFKSSFEFIRKILTPFKDFIVYIPRQNSSTVPIEVTLEEMTEKLPRKISTSFVITSVKFKGTELFNAEDDDYLKKVDIADFKARIAYALAVPRDLLTISSNIPLKGDLKLKIGDELVLRRADQ